MALLSIESIAPGIQLGLWAIEDTTEQLMAQDPRLARVTEAERYHADARRREVLAVYALLFAMTGDSSKRIAHDELNRPLPSSSRAMSTWRSTSNITARG